MWQVYAIIAKDMMEERRRYADARRRGWTNGATASRPRHPARETRRELVATTAGGPLGR